jgi:hypothetical protein
MPIYTLSRELVEAIAREYGDLESLNLSENCKTPSYSLQFQHRRKSKFPYGSASRQAWERLQAANFMASTHNCHLRWVMKVGQRVCVSQLTPRLRRFLFC